MSEDRFREVFRRITAETPDPPDFGDLEIHHAEPAPNPWMKPWVVVVGAATIVLIVIGGFGLLGGGPDLAAPAISSTTMPMADIPADCPVTIPDGSFTPPAPYRANRDDGLVWFGTEELWTVLSPDGTYPPRKSVWWSKDYADPGIDPDPDITVTWNLLGGSQEITFPNDGATNGSTREDGLFMIAGIDPDLSGCWEVNARFGGANLSYVYYRPNGLANELVGLVPDVVGESVSQAQSILESYGYKAAWVDSGNLTYEVCAQEPGAGLEIDPGAIVGMRTAPAGECAELMNPEPTLSLNPDYLSYEDEYGHTWYATACPTADVLVLGGVDAADGLPNKSQTWQQQVDLTNTDASSLATAWDDLAAVPRNGEVWDRDDNGNVIVEQVADFMAQITLADDAPCPDTPVSWNGVPVAYVRASGLGDLCPVEPPLSSSQVKVFFDCGNGVEPNPTGFARPLHPDAPDRITSVFWHMLAGPTLNERGRGSGSFFNETSANALISAELTGDHLIVDFNDGILVNNGSTTTGSLYLLSELTSNAFSVDEVRSVEFRINGSCEGFWAFLQAGDDVCTIIDRP